MAEKVDILIVGSGMGSLTAGALLAQKGKKVTVLEQNWQPGGCTSSYWRKGFVFEAGATTLVGLGDHMPLQYVLDKTGIALKTRRLQLPMRVHLANGQVVNRYENPEQWIAEAEKLFGAGGQRAFWEEAFQISDFVWKTSLKQRLFPPSRPADLLNAVRNVTLDQVKNLPGAFKSTRSLLQKHGLTENKLFCDFVNEQLLITAQNHMEEVSTLFGATALCYTNYPNFYVDGGLLNLVTPFVDYIKGKGGAVRLREGVEEISRKEGFYEVITKKQAYQAQYVISGIPVNDTLEMFNPGRKNGVASKLMQSEELNSAFQMGIGFEPHRTFETIHHQMHLEQPLAETGSASIFISLNHPEDKSRTDEPGQSVMSVSTHLPDPAHKIIDGDKAAEAVVEELVRRNFLKKENIIYQHSSTQKSWAKWTGRKWGFVGGYPQYMAIKPWQMLDARLDKHKAYMVGDTVYPGQGIPGVTLSAIVAVEKLCRDWAL